MTQDDSELALRDATVIANCHTGPIAQILAFNGLGLNVDGIYLDGWHDPQSDAREKGKALLESRKADSLVFSFNVSANFDMLETSQLRSVFGDRLITFTNVRFDGLHPDTTYFGPFGGRWGNFLSEYHSKIVLHSYAAGRSVEDCLGLFNGKTYEKLGYYDVFRKSEEELRSRDLNCDVKFCDVFFQLVREEFCLLTINHPTTVVFSRLVEMLCDKAGIPFLHHDERMYPNPLVQAPIWPIYNEVAEHLSLKYRTPQYFVRPPFGYVANESRSISLKQFVAGSYQFYDAHFPKAEFNAAVEQMDADLRFRNGLG